MSYLAGITLYDADYQGEIPMAHSTGIVEYAYAMALDECRIKTREFKSLNIIRASHSRLKPPAAGVVELYLAFDPQRLDRLEDEPAERALINLIYRGMKMIERAGYIPSGSSDRVRQRVWQLGLRIRTPMTKWRKDSRSGDAFRLTTRTLHNGISVDAEVRRKGGGHESFQLFRSWYPPHFFRELVLDSTNWQSRDKIEVVVRRPDPNVERHGVRRIDIRGSQNKPSVTSSQRVAKLCFQLKTALPEGLQERWNDA